MKKNESLNYIKSIAQAKSISAAAENLGISQPALSAHLKKVESELDTVLFDRSRQPLELTEAGKVYLDYLDKMTVLHKGLVQGLSDINDLRTGALTVGGASFFNVAYLPGAIAAFAKDYPGVEIEIVDGKVPELVNMAQKGILDLFITPINDEPDRFIYEELLTEKVYLAVPSEWQINRELEHKAVTVDSGGEDRYLSRDELEGLCDNTFAVLKSDQDIGRKMQAIMDRYGCRPKRTITAEQTMTTLALTQKGVGISLITESSIRYSGLAELPKLYLTDPEICSRKMYVAYSRHKYLSKAAAAFISVMKETNRV